MKTSSELSPPTSVFDLEVFLREQRALIDAELDRFLPAESVEPVSVHQAIRWSVFAGGKRFRPILLLATGEVFGGHSRELLATACALEMIHTYSLIHDDLPSMDDDKLRRGRPTCHIQFDEATAILAGDGLQSLAFQTIAEEFRLAAEKRVVLVSELGRAAGTPLGMVAGQARDLQAESRAVTTGELERIHRLKTAALIIAAARCGAIIAEATDRELDAVGRYGAHLGLLFQITDDLLDITATAETLGKTPGKDARAQKATYPSLYGIESARRRANVVYQEACAALDQIERPTERLRTIADFILKRDT
jgi:geranylgeranyl diphosphate synthase, type II